ncbi:phosphoribosylformylglycinamidine synthase subunit PurL [Candidatus Thorarchaeota archaeon]|nr:MAG: phosphoribosylformylglycinamidine synthase subunit PurL [Candidatus Thorarchaeota archaeon]
MLTQTELDHAAKVLGRKPNETELAMLDVLWSEHCSYKSSKRWFHLFKTKGDRVYLGIGEGAGLVDIGDGILLGVAMESHNHPSQVDPYNGAATGVGGIIRDVISQGCKAVGLMNCLHFGHPGKPKNAHLLDHVVRGISDYGNSVGIPMVGGDLSFDDSYEGNCLVNVICIGMVRPGKVVRSSAKTPGDHLVIFGSTTGRDGIAGVSFASETFSDQEEENRGAVQIGDPLAKKVLIDVLSELVEKGLLEGLQDLGGGGLTSCAGEMASNGGTGVTIEVDRVPLREVGMTPWEIIVSESQERMLGVVSPENINEVLEILAKSEAPHAVIGHVTDDHLYTVLEAGEVRARLPVDLLVEGFPVPERVEGVIPVQKQSLEWLKDHYEFDALILDMLGSLNICDRSWVYSQYDQHVQINTVVDIGENAGVLEFPFNKRIAFSSDCNSQWCLLDPQQGTANSAAECLRNIVSMGARPILLADCLNFGNPERPDSYAQYVESVRGLGRFSNDFDIPVVAGNVSLYNEAETEGKIRRVNPTPQIMLAGIFEPGYSPIRRNLCTPWANLLLVGDTLPELNGTEFQRMTTGKIEGIPPVYRPKREKSIMNAMLEAHKFGLVRSCNNLGRGGIAIALMKMVMHSDYGFKVDLDYVPGSTSRDVEVLFSETSARYIAEVTESNQQQFMQIMEKHETSAVEIGLTVNDSVADFGDFEIDMREATEVFQNGLRQYME